MSKYGIHNTTKEVMILMAKNLRSVRKEKKLSQKELSARSGVAYASLMKFETTGSISLKSLLKLSKALGRLEEFEHILQSKNTEYRQSLFDI